MASGPEPPSLFHRLAAFGGLPRRVVACLLAAAVAVPLLAAADALLRHDPSSAQALWRLAMAPTLVTFIVLADPWLQRRWGLAQQALAPLVRGPVAFGRAGPVRPGEWVAFALGLAFALWTSLSEPRRGWTFAFAIVTDSAMFGLLALAIADGFYRAALLKRVFGAGLALDVFDRESLMPLARAGQSVSLAFVGGICLSLMFQSSSSLYTVQSLVIYATLVLVALTAFFRSIWSIHAALVAAQRSELAIARRHGAQARRELLRRRAELPVPLAAESAAALYQASVLFSTYERQVLEASTWPFNANILKQLAASVAAPVVVYVLRLASGWAGYH